MRKKSLLFYDGTCGLCDKCVQFVLKRDSKKHFLFAPLQGITAQGALSSLTEKQKSIDSMILIDDYQTANQIFYFRGKAALRVLWILGGPWSLLGALHILPSFFYNWIYDLVARSRLRFFSQKSCRLPDANNDDCFLD